MSRKTPEHHEGFRLKKSSLLQLIILAVAILIIAPQFKQFAGSWRLLGQLDIGWVILAVIAMSVSILFATLVYLFLVPEKLPFKRTAAIQLATYFTNRLLPSGLGGIGFNALYLVKQAKLSRTESSVYATANNLIGFVAFMICMWSAALFSSTDLSPHIPIKIILITIGSVALLIAIVSVFIKSVQKKIIDFLGHLVAVVINIIRHPKRLVAAIFSSIGITISYAATLWLCSKSVGINLSILDLFIAFLVGNTALTISPTPGGLGAVEAAIVGVLVATNIEPAQALAAVVLFRLISYWAPIIPGYISFRWATKNDYV